MGLGLDRRVVVSGVVLLGVAIASFVASAELGGPDGVYVPYTGRLELDGQPVSGTVRLRFQVDDRPGVSCHVETRDVVVSAGAFAIVLGPLEDCLYQDNVSIGVSVVDEAGGVTALGGQRRIHPALGAVTSGGGDLLLRGNGEIYFQDNGQLRSLDDNHRIMFRRSDNILELREIGDVVISSGASGGQETRTAVFQDNGDVEIEQRVVFPESGARIAFNQGPAGPYEIGHQNGTIYFRSPNFGWYSGGSWNNTALDPGTDGEVLMTLDRTEWLTVAGRPAVVGPSDVPRQATVWGHVAGNGTVRSGSGYSVTKPASTTGKYRVAFDEVFLGIPAVVLTQVALGLTDPNAQDNCVITGDAYDSTGFGVNCGDSQGTPTNRGFSFIAMGQLPDVQ